MQDANKPHPEPSKPSGYKRIIVCCDGTWQDGIDKQYRCVRTCASIEEIDNESPSTVGNILISLNWLGCSKEKTLDCESISIYRLDDPLTALSRTPHVGQVVYYQS